MWMTEATDSTLAGIGSGVPLWVLEGQHDNQRSTIQGGEREAIQENRHESKKTENNHFDEEQTVTTTGSPQSVADDSLSGDVGMSTVKNSGHGQRGDPRSRSRGIHERSGKSMGLHQLDRLGVNRSALSHQSSSLLTEKRFHDAEKLLMWLDKLQLIVEERKAFIEGFSPNSKIPELTDGVLLGRLAFRLERVGSIPGFTLSPRTPAQGLQNIKRVLEVFSRNNKIPLSSLSVADELFAGEGHSILNLLSVVRHAYGHHLL